MFATLWHALPWLKPFDSQQSPLRPLADSFFHVVFPDQRIEQFGGPGLIVGFANLSSQ